MRITQKPIQFQDDGADKGRVGDIKAVNFTGAGVSATATNQNTGGGGAHNNLQPYIVVYMWKRTA